jgi:hypothetical protein
VFFLFICLHPRHGAIGGNGNDVIWIKHGRDIYVFFTNAKGCVRTVFVLRYKGLDGGCEHLAAKAVAGNE